MYKLILLIISFSVSQGLLAQQEKMELGGAISITNNDDPSPEAGTIRWTGEDFQGFDGFVWKSLTQYNGSLTKFCSIK